MKADKNKVNKEETFLAEKDGFEPRRFTMRQLEAMGTDPGGNSYDGWVITGDVKIPEELLGNQKTDSSDDNTDGVNIDELNATIEDQNAQIADLKGKVETLEGKLKAERAKTKAAKDTATKTNDSDAITGKTESGGTGEHIDSERSGTENSTQGSKGDGKAD